MIETAILSGKGGTGKTSLAAAFATLGNQLVVADCDVDAANLHLILSPENYLETVYTSGHTAVIDDNKCINCGVCETYCRFDAIHTNNGKVVISAVSCDGCMLCSRICPEKAITMVPNNRSRWYTGNYRNGKMIHARLAPGEENSGKLVNVVREKAKRVAKETGWPHIIIDGPPGTGCSAISSITGVDRVIIVTEPTNSGFHDMKRMSELSANFKIPTFVIINKFDLNPGITLEIAQWCDENGLKVIGQLPFDKAIVDAMVHCQSIIEWAPDSEISITIKSIWQNLMDEQPVKEPDTTHIYD